MQTTQLSAPDIECDGCANAIKRAVSAVDGVSAVAVDVEEKRVTVTHDPQVTKDAIIAVLDRAGFPANE